MSKIHLMSESLANKIAAGEVVERPASVVKELIENSIDAGSKNIEIHLIEGGLKSIKIIDDGEGMSRDDAEKCFLRHATSKIKTDQDLFHINTLGFRGEAIPSIASVSYFTLVTSDGETGTKVIYAGGKKELVEKTQLKKGTQITVEHLFFNTPARLKYMSTTYNEVARVNALVNRIALSHPDIAFKLTNNKKELLNTDGSNNTKKVLHQIYGMEVTKALVSFESENFDFKIKGHLTKPLVTRASKNHITIIVNGRAIRNYKIVNAVVDAYHTFMPKGRYPIGLIEINLDPYLIDVNVHPSKQEVRISKESDLVDLLKSTIKDRLNKKEHIPKVEVKRSKVFVEQPTLDLRVNKEKTYEQKPVYKEVRYDDRPKNDFKEEINILKDVEEQVATNSVIINEDRIVLPINKNEKVVNEQPIFKEEIIEEVLEEIDHVKEDVLDVVFDDPTETRFPELEVVGQIHGTYIITQNKDGMYLIDQHAAQERINYELYYKKLGNNQHEVIDLLIPHTIEFRNDEAMLVKENFDAIRSHGIDIDEFGNNAFIIRAHPIWFEEGKELEIVEEVIDTLLKKKLVSVSKLREEMAINMSCKRSIKANRFLTQDEMERLIHDLSTCAHPFSCPHGRPVLVHFSSYDLEKMFKRVM